MMPLPCNASGKGNTLSFVCQNCLFIFKFTPLFVFRDEQVYLFTSIVSSGVGGGMILFSTMFFLLEPSLGRY